MILFDTNILIYAIDRGSKFHKTAKDWLLKSEKGEIEGVMAVQNIGEFAAVVRDKRRVEVVVEKDLMIEHMRYFRKDALKVIYPNDRTIVIFEELVKKNKFGQKRMFDLLLAATMISNRVEEILTYNKNDFMEIEGIRVIEP